MQEEMGICLYKDFFHAQTILIVLYCSSLILAALVCNMNVRQRDMLCVLHPGDEARLLNVSAEELKLLMETMAKETLSSYQVYLGNIACCTALFLE